jgi:glutaredoxin
MRADMGVSRTGPTVTLYGRAGCHLCEQAAALLRGMGCTVNEVDIDTDAALLARYDTAVPVVVLGDAEIARAPIDRAALERRLALSRRRRGA